jgi:ubiquitin C-terminal hydrolase
MSTLASVSRNPIPSCLNDIQNRIYSAQEKICGLCSTDNKIYAFLILGRVLQAAALTAFVASIAFAFVIGPISLVAMVPAIALGILGTHIAGNPQGVNDMLRMDRPFATGQPVGLDNSGNNCWVNSGLQLLVNSPAFHRRMRQIPEFAQFLDAYIAAEGNYQKVAGNIDTQAIRQFLSRETSGTISAEAHQEDAAQLFEYLFQGPNALYQFDQQINGGIANQRREPLIQIGLDPGSNFQGLFDNFFDYRTDIGQHIQLFFPRAPDDLLIQAKRFYQRIDPVTGVLQQGKINDPIEMTERLTLPNRFVRTGESREYLCDGFSVHRGTGQNVGHYISYLKKGNTWWYCSDTSVYEVSTPQALDAMKNGYIFHFAKI